MRAVILVAALLLTACSGAPNVNFATPALPIDATEYRKVQRRWSRHSHINTGVVDTAWDAHITLVSDELRAAYVSKVAAMRKLTDVQRRELDAAQRDDGDKYVDFVIELYTGRWEWNDLGSTRTLWTLTLRDDQGHALGKPEVNSVPEKPDLLDELFSPTTPFTRAWRVRFPRPLPENAGRLLNPETRWVVLSYAGPLGSGESRWDTGLPPRPPSTTPPPPAITTPPAQEKPPERTTTPEAKTPEK